MDEEELIAAVRNGDRNAFGELAERHRAMLYRVVWQMIGDKEIANEFVQETLLQAYLSLDRLRQPALFAAWLRGILRNLCQNYLRSQRGYALSMEQLLEQWDDDDLRLSSFELDPYEQWEAHELSEQIQQALGSLSLKNRQAVQLFYFEQRSLAEMAKQLAVSTNVIKGRLFQARQQLRIQLSPHYSLPDANKLRLDSSKKSRLHNKGSNKMVKISKLHAVANEVGENYLIYLLDTEKARVLKIWVGPAEGMQIAATLQGESTYRPMTFQFMATTFEKIGAQVEEVRVEALKDFTFYAVVKVRNGKETVELDARPSDAIGLALYLHAPIFVAEEVMAQNGEALPQPFDEAQWLAGEQSRYADQQAITAEWQQRLTNDDTMLAADARDAMAQAISFARTMNHSYVGTEHLLMGLLMATDQPAAPFLHKVGVNQTNAATAFDRIVGRGATPLAVDPVIVPQVVNLWMRACREASQLEQLPCTGMHLLLAMLCEGKGMAIRLLRELEVNTAQLRAELQQSLK